MKNLLLFIFIGLSSFLYSQKCFRDDKQQFVVMADNNNFYVAFTIATGGEFDRLIYNEKKDKFNSRWSTLKYEGKNIVISANGKVVLPPAECKETELAVFNSAKNWIVDAVNKQME